MCRRSNTHKQQQQHRTTFGMFFYGGNRLPSYRQTGSGVWARLGQRGDMPLGRLTNMETPDHPVWYRVAVKEVKHARSIPSVDATTHQLHLTSDNKNHNNTSRVRRRGWSETFPSSEDFTCLTFLPFTNLHLHPFPSPRSFSLWFLCISKGLHNFNHAISHLLNKK